MITVSEFGKTPQGEVAHLYEISNSKGMCAKVSDFGANLTALIVPDKDGNLTDVCLGFDNAMPYGNNLSFFGAVIGPSANRINDAKFTIDGVEYKIDVNDGKNNLHSDIKNGIHKRMWMAEQSENSVTFAIESDDMDMGFPGNKVISVTYTLTENNELKLSYAGTSDKNTIMNPTNHAYFNLSGANCGKNIEDHILTLNCSKYTPVVEGAIPTGELADVKGTVMDFTNAKAIGERINDNFEQLLLTKGYDHNYVIDGWDGNLREVAKVEDPKSGRIMKVYTTLPGIQFYAGNCIGDEEGKEGVIYTKRSGMCLETQFFPDTINQPNFPGCVFGPGKDYVSETVYAFE